MIPLDGGAPNFRPGERRRSGPESQSKSRAGGGFLGRWIKSLRPYSFSASAMPVLLAAALASTTPEEATWWYLAPFALSALLLHAGTNVLNDYYDFVHGVDRVGDPDPTHVITQGMMSPRFMKISGHLYFVAGVAVGATIALARGPLFFAAGLLGALGAYSYTNARWSLKYRALGDIVVFLLMGPALVVMGLWALEGIVSPSAALVSLPVAFLVTAILHGNNLRNIIDDSDAGILTLAIALGLEGSKLFFAALVLLSYLAVVGLVASGFLGVGALLALGTLPLGVSLVRDVLAAEKAAILMGLPIKTARLHLVFSGLFVAGIVLGGLLGI